MNTRIPKPVVNTQGLAYKNQNKEDFLRIPNDIQRHELKVTFILDPLPGIYDQPKDIMNKLAQHSYVDTVEFIDPQNTPSMQKLEAEISNLENSISKEALYLAEVSSVKEQIRALIYALAVLRGDTI